MQFPLISVVTVVYNDIAHIVETMDSVVGQDYPHIEYIIIDGASSDGTKEKIIEYIASCAKVDSQVDSKKIESLKHTEQNSRIYLEAKHREKDLTFTFLSEKDSGIYDAMNKGIELATGQWCNFMNCGDRFYDLNTTKNTFNTYLQAIQSYNLNNINLFNIVAIYGDTMFILDSTHSKIPRYHNNPRYSIAFCHQSVFARTELLKKYKFDTNFKICADIDFFTKIYNEGGRYFYTNNIVSCVDGNGLSSKPSWQFFKEQLSIGTRHNIFFGLYFAPTYLAKTIVKKFFPYKLRLFIQSHYNTKGPTISNC